MAATIASAQLPSDSDPEDEDYEDTGANDVPAHRSNPRDSARASIDSSGDDEQTQERRCRAAKIWAEMCAEEQASTARRPPCVPLDALSRQFQCRHPRPPKQRSRRAIFAELAKYSNAVGVDAVGPSTADVKREVRSAAAAARAACGKVTPSLARPRRLPLVIEDTVRFAGASVTVRRRALPGSLQEKQHLQAQKRLKRVELGGQLASLDAFLCAATSSERGVSVIEKSDLDWQAHKDRAGLDDLARDPHAGALERKAFLARTKARSEEVVRVARVAARAQAAQLRDGP